MKQDRTIPFKICHVAHDYMGNGLGASQADTQNHGQLKLIIHQQNN